MRDVVIGKRLVHHGEMVLSGVTRLKRGDNETAAMMRGELEREREREVTVRDCDYVKL